MRKMLSLLLLCSACSVPPNALRQPDTKINEQDYVMPEIIVQPKEKEHEQPKYKIRGQTARFNQPTHCASIDTGMLRNDINAKLDCLVEFTK